MATPTVTAPRRPPAGSARRAPAGALRQRECQQAGHQQHQHDPDDRPPRRASALGRRLTNGLNELAHPVSKGLIARIYALIGRTPNDGPMLKFQSNTRMTERYHLAIHRNPDAMRRSGNAMQVLTSRP